MWHSQYNSVCSIHCHSETREARIGKMRTCKTEPSQGWRCNICLKTERWWHLPIQYLQWNQNSNVYNIYIYISSVMHAFWLILTYDLLEDKRIDDATIKTFSVYFNSLLYKTNRFQVAVRLFSNRSQRTSKCGKNISDTLGCASCATFLFLPHFDVICDLLLNRHTATWNLFFKYIHCKLLFVINPVSQGSRVQIPYRPEFRYCQDRFQIHILPVSHESIISPTKSSKGKRKCLIVRISFLPYILTFC